MERRFGPQTQLLTGSRLLDLSNILTTSQNPSLAEPLCYISAAIVGILGLYAVYYNIRQASVRKPRTGAA